MLQNWDAFFKCLRSLTDRISLSRSERAELEELRTFSDRSAYQRRREIFSQYIGLLLRTIILDVIGCSIPSLASRIGCSKQRLYRITNGQVINGLYEIFCILFLLGLPFPDVFSAFVPESILTRRKVIERRRDMENQDASRVSSSETSEICQTASPDTSAAVPSCLDMPSIPYMNQSAEGPSLSSDHGHPLCKSLLNIFRSENGEILLHIPAQVIHRSADRPSAVHIPLCSDHRSEKRTVRTEAELKSGIRISIPGALVSFSSGCYVDVQEPVPLPQTYMPI